MMPDDNFGLRWFDYLWLAFGFGVLVLAVFGAWCMFHPVPVCAL